MNKHDRFRVRKLYRRQGSRYWQVKIYDRRTQHLHRLSTKTGSKVNARQFIDDWIEQRSHGEEVPIRVAWSRFLEGRDISQNTIEGFKCSYQNHFRKLFDDRLVSEMEVYEVEKFLRSLKSSYSQGFRRRLRQQLSTFFNWCLKQRYTNFNPVSATEAIRLPMGEARAITFDQASELALILRDRGYICQSHRRGKQVSFRRTFSPSAYGFLRIGLNTGLRVKNLIHLDWERNVDLDNRLISFDASEMKARIPFSIPINDNLYAYLRLLVNRSRSVLRSITGRGHTYPPHQIKKALPLAGIDPSFAAKEITRKTFASWLTSLGVNWPVVQELMGHSRRQHITQTYVEITYQTKLDALNRLPSLP